MLHVRVDVPPIPEALEALAEGLVRLNMVLMAYAEDRGVPIPELYESGVVYRREPEGREWWETASDMLQVAKDRSGDCEDLAAYRAAELRLYDGEDDAHVAIIRTSRGSFHCIVIREDGSEEDPSLTLLEIESEKTGVPMESLANLKTIDTRYTP